MIDAVINRLTDGTSIMAMLSEAKEVVKSSIGINNTFYFELLKVDPYKGNFNLHHLNILETLRSFRYFVENEFISTVSFQRTIKLDVVNDFLEQAQDLLNNDEVHPAIPITIIGAGLEEFLRTWIEECDTKYEEKSKSINSYAIFLKKENCVTKQDVKDITAWAGLRNSAAHGKWEEVSEKIQANIMLSGVNLFIRKYSEDKMKQ